MAELADALDSGSSRGNSVEVQVLLAAPRLSRFYLKAFLNKAIIPSPKAAPDVSIIISLIAKALPGTNI